MNFWVESGARNHMVQDAWFWEFQGIRVEGAPDVNEERVKPVKRPRKDTVRASVFKERGRMGSVKGVIISQFIDAPPTIAPRLSIAVEKEQKMSVSLTGFVGLTLIGPQTTALRKRAVYLTVKPVARKNKIIIIKFVGLAKEYSRIRSFE